MNHAAEHLLPETLSAFLDGELAFRERQMAEQHLAQCHACTLRVLSASQLKSATARAGNSFAPSPETLARLTGQLRTPPRTQRSVFAMHAIRWSAVAAALVVILSLLGRRQFHQGDMLAAELLDQHLAALSSGATPQVLSTDRHTVKPWFQGRLPFSFNIPDAGALPAETTLKGADLAYIHGQPAALLLFTIHKHEVSVFLTQRAAGLGPSLLLPRGRAGFNLRSSTTQNLSFVAVSDVNPADLDALMSALLRAQSPA